jgi:hypothetical protein
MYKSEGQTQDWHDCGSPALPFLLLCPPPLSLHGWTRCPCVISPRGSCESPDSDCGPDWCLVLCISNLLPSDAVRLRETWLLPNQKALRKVEMQIYQREVVKMVVYF